MTQLSERLRAEQPCFETLEERLLLAAVPLTMTSVQAESLAYFHNDGEIHNSLQDPALLTSSGDVDSWVFAGLPGWNGTYSFRVESHPAIYASMGIYDGATGVAKRILQIGPSTVAFFVETGMVGGKEYVFALGDLNGSTFGNLNVRIDSYGSGLAWLISLDGVGDGSYTLGNIQPDETDFYRFVAPLDTNGHLKVTVDPDTASLAPAVAIIGLGGSLVGQAYTTTAGDTVTASVTGLTPGETYYASVMGQKHATIGDYDIRVDFGVAPVVAALSASPKVVFAAGAIGLEATGVGDADGDLLGVQFFRDANGNQVLDGADTFLGADVNGADGWTYATSAAGLADGKHYFFARAVDGQNTYSAVAADWVYHNPVPGDANLDGKVDVFDLAILANNYGAPGGMEWMDADFTGDGAVNVHDLAQLANNYGHGTGAGAEAAGEAAAFEPTPAAPAPPGPAPLPAAADAAETAPAEAEPMAAEGVDLLEPIDLTAQMTVPAPAPETRLADAAPTGRAGGRMPADEAPVDLLAGAALSVLPPPLP